MLALRVLEEDACLFPLENANARHLIGVQLMKRGKRAEKDELTVSRSSKGVTWPGNLKTQVNLVLANKSLKMEEILMCRRQYFKENNL